MKAWFTLKRFRRKTEQLLRIAYRIRRVYTNKTIDTGAMIKRRWWAIIIFITQRRKWGNASVAKMAEIEWFCSSKDEGTGVRVDGQWNRASSKSLIRISLRCWYENRELACKTQVWTPISVAIRSNDDCEGPAESRFAEKTLQDLK